MSDKSRIEWTERTWSPITGCTKVSQGCKNCYAEREVETRWSKNPKSIWFGRKFTDIQCHPEQLDAPMRWKTPSRIFVCPRSDLFHESVPDEFIDRVFAVMALCPRHTFQVLTKRPERMRDYLCARNGLGNPEICSAINSIPYGLGNRHGALSMPLPNVWLGVSVEDQTTADERIPLLLQTPAAVRWISAEPLLGPIDLRFLTYDHCGPWDRQFSLNLNALTGFRGTSPCSGIDGPRLDWCVVGGESGPEARPMHPDWVRSLRDQCQAAGVPFFFKQWGEWLGVDHQMVNGEWPTDEDYDFTNDCYRIGKKAAGRLLDGRTWDQYPGGSNAAAV